MAALKHSRQRECIKQFLIGRHDHPTADVVYSHVKEQFPNVSLGTIYRNLSLLSELGEIRKITCNGPDRFDANIMPHSHFICSSCGKVSDLTLEEDISFENFHPMNFYGVIEKVNLDFSGTCEACIKKV